MTNKNVEAMRKWLKSYRLTIKEIQARAEHIRWLKKELYTPLSESGKGSDRYAAAKVKEIMGDIVCDAEMRLETLKHNTAFIENAIAQLDGFESCILYNRYIVGLQWLDMPERVGYEIAQCQRIERKAMEHLSKLPCVKQFLDKNSAAPVHKPLDYLALG